MFRKSLLIVWAVAISVFAICSPLQATQSDSEPVMLNEQTGAAGDALVFGYYDARNSLNFLTATATTTFASNALDNWHLRTSFQNTSIIGIAYGNDGFIAVGSEGGDASNCYIPSTTAYASPDGATWTKIFNLWPQGRLNGVAHDNGTLVAVGSQYSNVVCNNDGSATYQNNGVVYVNSNGNFAYIDPKTNATLYGIAYGSNGIWVAVGDNGTILTSTDTKTWQPQSSGTIGTFTAITYGNGIFMAVGYDNYSAAMIYTSSDGKKWTNRSPMMAAIPLYGVTFGNNTFVAVGGTYPLLGSGEFSQIILTTTDLVSWKSVDTGSSDPLYAVAYGGSTFVAVGSASWGSAKILSSSDGATWTARTSNGIFSLRSIAYGNNTFVVAEGGYGYIYQSDPLSQASSCTYTITPTSKTFTSKGGSGTVAVKASPSTCTWTATESLSWVSIKSGSKGTGNGTVKFSVSANNSGATRTGNMTIAGKTFVITQTK